MALKPRGLSPSRSPSTKRTATLANIPEAVPGPNAFAMQAHRVERHRVQGNAFYQQEVQKRGASLPTAVHPALRSQPTSNNPYKTAMLAPQQQQQQRESSITTMSPFINAGQEYSPPLNLGPLEEEASHPTIRGFIEERREQHQHAASGTEAERTPVYLWETKPAQPVAQSPKRKPAKNLRISLPKQEGSTSETAKSPVRMFFERLRTGPRNGASSPSPSPAPLTEAPPAGCNVPVKAQAVLGASSAKVNLSRTSSKKRMGLFPMRKNTEASENDFPTISHPRPLASDLVEDATPTADAHALTPQTGSTGTKVYDLQFGRRVESGTASTQKLDTSKEVNKCPIQRSQSLRYLDGQPPPTPPAKNTPPDVKAERQRKVNANVYRRGAGRQVEITPSRYPAEGVVSTDPNRSPTKFGGHGHRGTPTLITKPSVYSLRASVVPNLTEPKAFEDMKSRLDGLSLEGFNTPAENTYPRSPEFVYSPSVYNDEWDARAQSIAMRTPGLGNNFTTDDLPTVFEEVSPAPEMKIKEPSKASSGETIGLYYPDLVEDPMRVTVRRESDGRPSFVTETESLDASVAEAGEGGDSPTSDELVLAAAQDEMKFIAYESPTSFSHHSAVPSPLQYLPATTYTPPPPRSRKATMGSPHIREMLEHGLGIYSPTPTSTRAFAPTSSPDPLDNAPVLRASHSPELRVTPRPSIVSLVSEFAAEVKATKKPDDSSETGSSDTEQILILLKTIAARQNDVEAIRDDVRTTNARLDERLAAIEAVRQQTRLVDSTVNDHMPGLPRVPALPPARRSDRGERNRVATRAAYDFYRFGPQAPKGLTSADNAGGKANEDGMVVSEKGGSDADALAEMMKVNETLLHMVNGFAEKLADLQKKLDEKEKEEKAIDQEG